MISAFGRLTAAKFCFVQLRCSASPRLLLFCLPFVVFVPFQIEAVFQDGASHLHDWPAIAQPKIAILRNIK